ncbi:hypothetical protein [Pantoea agglomerans]|uniref:hypothetical protein n=1 Tax=Enterobacter agglomerans TaxID=549 RepID=UPI0035268679
MGATKDRVMDYYADQHKNSWMTQHIPPGAVEGDAIWQKYSEKYDFKMECGDFDNEDHFYGPEPDYDDDINWSKVSDFHQYYTDFKNQLANLSNIPAPADGILLDVALKMRFSYAVTLMEACLGDMLKNVTLSDDFFKRKALAGIKPLKTTKVNLESLLGRDASELVDKEIYSELTDLLYHNIEKVNIYYSVILGFGDPHNLDLSEGLTEKVCQAVSLRHDVVHRNGRDKEGNTSLISQAIVDDYIEAIQQYVRELYDLLDKVSYQVDLDNAQRIQQEQI